MLKILLTFILVAGYALGAMPAKKSVAEYTVIFENEWTNILSPEQKLSILDKMVRHTKNNLSYTAGAMHWREAIGGSQEMALSDNKDDSWDCGPFGGNTRTIANRLGMKHNSANKKVICTKLIKDEDFADWNFVEELKYWNAVHKDFDESFRWYRVWGSYNGGYTPNDDHANVIAAMIQVLKRKNTVDIYLEQKRLVANKVNKYLAVFP